MRGWDGAITYSSFLICYYLILFVFYLLESGEGSALRSKHHIYLTSTANRGEQKDCNENIGVLRAFYNNDDDDDDDDDDDSDDNNNNNNNADVDENDGNDNDNDSDSENENNKNDFLLSQWQSLHQSLNKLRHNYFKTSKF